MTTATIMERVTSNGHRDRDDEGNEDENECSDEDEDEEKDDFFAVEIDAETGTKPCKGSWACSRGYFRFGGDCDEQVVQHCVMRCRRQVAQRCRLTTARRLAWRGG